MAPPKIKDLAKNELAFKKALKFHQIKKEHLARFIAKRMLEFRHPSIEAANQNDKESSPALSISDRWAEWADSDDTSKNEDQESEESGGEDEEKSENES